MPLGPADFRTQLFEFLAASFVSLYAHYLNNETVIDNWKRYFNGLFLCVNELTQKTFRSMHYEMEKSQSNSLKEFILSNSFQDRSLDLL